MQSYNDVADLFREPVDVRERSLQDLPWHIQVPDVFKGVLISQQQIQNRVATLRGVLAHDYLHKDLFVLAMLKGAVPFYVKLFHGLPCIPHVEGFIPGSSYVGKKQGEVVIDTPRLEKVLEYARERDVLVVEDIVDSGRTINKLLGHIDELKETFDLGEVKVCTLLDKPDARVLEHKSYVPDYAGFVIPDVWVVGCGLDTNQRYRNHQDVLVM
jgi:hypoxanthine phosphoribosyltransferase